jgi:hypothetical protein
MPVRTLVCSLLLVALAPLAHGAKARRAAAERVAREHLATLHGGTWNVTFVGHDKHGRAHLRVRSDNLLRRWFGRRAEGHVWVAAGAKVARVSLSPGAVTKKMRGHRVSLQDSRVQTVVTTGVATGVATYFGVPIDVALPMTSALGAWILVKDTRSRARLRSVADDLAERFASDSAAEERPPKPSRSARRAMSAMSMESVASAQLEAVSFDHVPEPPKKKGPSKKQLAREIRRSLGVE